MYFGFHEGTRVHVCECVCVLVCVRACVYIHVLKYNAFRVFEIYEILLVRKYINELRKHDGKSLKISTQK